MLAQAESISAVTIAEPRLLDNDGNIISQLHVGQQAIIRASLISDSDTEQPYLLIVEVRDGNGATRELFWQSGVITANGNYTFEMSWAATDDCWLDDVECANNYEIRSSAVSSFTDPQVIGFVAITRGIVVIGEPPDPPRDQHQFTVLLDDGRTYTINYSFSNGEGRILSIADEHENDTMRITLDSLDSSTFTLTIPDFLVNYYIGNSQMSSYEIRILVDGSVARSDILFDKKTRNYTLILSLGQGETAIRIVGLPDYRGSTIP